MRFVLVTTITTTLKLDDEGNLSVTNHDVQIDNGDVQALPIEGIKAIVAGAAQATIELTDPSFFDKEASFAGQTVREILGGEHDGGSPEPDTDGIV